MRVSVCRERERERDIERQWYTIECGTFDLILRLGDFDQFLYHLWSSFAADGMTLTVELLLALKKMVSCVIFLVLLPRLFFVLLLSFVLAVFLIDDVASSHKLNS